MNKCSVCELGFEDEYFDIEQNKCILHCEKDDWYEIKDNKKDWSKSTEKVKLFWEKIQEDLKEIDEHRYSKYILNNVKFPIFQAEQNNSTSTISTILNNLTGDFYLAKRDSLFDETDETKRSSELINTLEIEFNNCEFLDIANFEKYLFKQDIIFSKCTFKNEIKLNKQQKNRISFLECPEIKSLDVSKTIFEQKVEFKNCVIKSCNFENTRFKKVCDFHKTKFHCNSFAKTTFEDIVVFTEAEFYKDIDFKYTTFKKLAQFKDTVFEKTINLEDSIIKEEINFLNIKNKNNEKLKSSNMANRETARIIKHSFEKLDNIIEANRFYALEMEKRGKELFSKLIEYKFSVFFEWLIFCVHKRTSNHSQNWLLALIWIVIFSILGIANELSCSLYTFYYSDDKFNEIAKSFYNNIFKFKNKENITAYSLFIKIFMGYLIYQFIISIRQNTRRK